jgi:hypothetical protein
LDHSSIADVVSSVIKFYNTRPALAAFVPTAESAIPKTDPDWVFPRTPEVILGKERSALEHHYVQFITDVEAALSILRHYAPCLPSFAAGIWESLNEKNVPQSAGTSNPGPIADLIEEMEGALSVLERRLGLPSGGLLALDELMAFPNRLTSDACARRDEFLSVPDWHPPAL